MNRGVIFGRPQGVKIRRLLTACRKRVGERRRGVKGPGARGIRLQTAGRKDPGTGQNTGRGGNGSDLPARQVTRQFNDLQIVLNKILKRFLHSLIRRTQKISFRKREISRLFSLYIGMRYWYIRPSPRSSALLRLLNPPRKISNILFVLLFFIPLLIASDSSSYEQDPLLLWNQQSMVPATTVDFRVVEMRYGADSLQRGVLAIPDNAGDRIPVLVFFPGGAYYTVPVINENSFRLTDLWEALHCARGKIAVAIFSYRLAPNNLWPDQLEDSIRAIRYLRKIGRAYHLDTQRIIVMGHSAGGHLALMTGLQPASSFGEDFSGFRGIINYSGITNFQTNHPVIRQISRRLGLDDRTEWELSPALWISDSAPPIFTLHGKSDNLVPVKQAEDLIRGMNLANNQGAYLPVKNGNHVYLPFNPDLPVVPDRKTIARKAIEFASYQFSEGPVYDINNDGSINRIDVETITLNIDCGGYDVLPDGSVLGMSDYWTPFADVNHDGIVNSKDVQNFPIFLWIEEFRLDR